MSKRFIVKCYAPQFVSPVDPCVSETEYGTFVGYIFIPRNGEITVNTEWSTVFHNQDSFERAVDELHQAGEDLQYRKHYVT